MAHDSENYEEDDELANALMCDVESVSSELPPRVSAALEYCGQMLMAGHPEFGKAAGAADAAHIAAHSFLARYFMSEVDG